MKENISKYMDGIFFSYILHTHSPFHKMDVIKNHESIKLKDEFSCNGGELQKLGGYFYMALKHPTPLSPYSP